MKNFYLIILTIFMTASCAVDDVSVVDGAWEGREIPAIKLFSVVNGDLQEVASSAIGEEGKFSFAFKAQEEAFYLIGLTPATLGWNNIFYFKSGDDLNLTINETGGYSLTGKNSPENRELERWAEFIRKSGVKELSVKLSTTFNEFFPALDAFKAEDYRQEYNSNKAFNKHFADLQRFEILLYALNLISTPRTAHPGAGDYIGYYAGVSLSDITRDDALMKTPYGAKILASYIITAPFFKKNSYSDEQLKLFRSPTEVLEVVLPEMGDERTKGELVLMQSKYIQTYPGFLEFDERFGKYLVSEEQKERLNEVLNVIGNKIESHPAIDFRFPDREGKQRALSDFVGKVVYVDIWATWCTPCLGEIPHLKELEEEYHSKDVIFIGVSTDKGADRDKWLTFLKEKELKGIQLFAGDRAQKELMRPYNISGIPRFLLIGKDGKVISSNAPRPSSSEIKTVLNDALKR